MAPRRASTCRGGRALAADSVSPLVLALLMLGLVVCGNRAVAAPSTPAAKAPRSQGITVHRLQPVAGGRPLHQGKIVPLNVNTSAGGFRVGLYRGLAPQSVRRIVWLVFHHFYTGKPVYSVNHERFIFGRPTHGAKLPPAVKEVNLARPTRGAVFFDGRSRLAILLSRRGGPKGWICVGQALIGARFLAALKPVHLARRHKLVPGSVIVIKSVAPLAI